MLNPWILWVLVTPFAAAALVYRTAPLNRFVGRHYWPSLALGWTGGAMLVPGAVLQGATAGDAFLLIGAPLLGLGFWTRNDAGDGGSRPDAPEPDPREGDPVDWDRFMRELAEWGSSHARTGRGPAGRPLSTSHGRDHR